MLMGAVGHSQVSVAQSRGTVGFRGRTPQEVRRAVHLHGDNDGAAANTWEGDLDVDDEVAARAALLPPLPWTRLC